MGSHASQKGLLLKTDTNKAIPWARPKAMPVEEPDRVRTGERELVRECRRGSEESWLEVYRLHRGIMMHAIVETMRRMGCENDLWHHRDDIFQEAFQHIYSHFGRYEERCSLATWLAVCSRQVTAREVRRLWRCAPRDSFNVPLDEEEPCPSTPHDEDIAARQLAGRLDDRVMAELTPKGRRFYRLLFKTGLSVGDICAMEGVSPEVVRTWRKRLRDLLWDHYCRLSDHKGPRPGSGYTR